MIYKRYLCRLSLIFTIVAVAIYSAESHVMLLQVKGGHFYLTLFF